MSKTIASLIVALLGLAGMQLSESAALEVAGLAVNALGIVAAWYFRATRGDVNAAGIKK